MKRLFGTDGIRGVAGESPLDPVTVRRFGAALAGVLAEDGRHAATVVLGRDTRESGPWLRDAVGHGLAAGGATAVDAGVITTPGLAHVVRHGPFDAGVMISASHNPFQDNGLKVFGAEGMKLSDALEHRVEERILDSGLGDPGTGGGAVTGDPSLVRGYVESLERVVGDDSGLAGLRVALDCANGSATAIAPEVFRHHGAEVVTLGVSPDGRNINLDCGSLHLDPLRRVVVERGLDVGIAFDGDADRALAVDRRGRVVDGDHTLYLAALGLHRQGELHGGVVVATVMSNLWIEKRLAEHGIRLLRAPVGDKYVLERMIAEDAVLGGEQSGHIIFRNHASTGDGVLTGLLLVETMARLGTSLEEVLDEIEPFPQVLLNVRVREKPDLRSHPAIGPALAGIEEELGGDGRVLLRYSGTEPLARVMVEGKDAGAVRRLAERLVGIIERELGV